MTQHGYMSAGMFGDSWAKARAQVMKTVVMAVTPGVPDDG
jgi:hypothetical protein